MASQSRGSLLRDINRMSTEIMALTDRSQTANEALKKESAAKANLVAKIAAADTEHTGVEKQKASESANDSELVGLQRAVAALTVRRQELIKATKTARAERDAAREEQAMLHYQLGGLQLETAIARNSSGSIDGGFTLHGQSAVWDTPCLALLTDAEGLWKRASNQSIVTRDLLDCALRSSGLRLSTTGGVAVSRDDADEAGAGAAPSESGIGGTNTAAFLSSVGPGVALSDCRKSLSALQELGEALAGARSRAGAYLTDSEAETQVHTDADGRAGALAAIDALLATVRANVHQQRSLLVAVERYYAGQLRESGKADEDEDRGGDEAR